MIEGEQHYRMSGKSGVGLFFLEEDSLFVVRNIVEGGSAWRDGTIKLSDICVAVDGTTIKPVWGCRAGAGAVGNCELGFQLKKNSTHACEINSECYSTHLYCVSLRNTA